MRIVFFVVCLFVLAACWQVDIADAAVEVGRKPNVIVILTDDQGFGDMSCHGNPFLKTNEIDRLAAESVRLTDFHVDPTCSPTRAALMTGRYATRVGVWLTYGSRHHLDSQETTMADVFRQNGYRTGIFGKWHLGDNYPFRPHDRGFDDSLVHGGGMIGETPDYWNNDYYDDTYLRNGKPEKTSGYCTDVWFDEAKKFIDRNLEQPFFLYLSTNAPHGPLHVPEKYTRKFRGKKGISSERAYFYGMIDCIDENIGKLREHLKSTGVDENTIIVFMNDNGTGHGAALAKNKKWNRNGWTTAGFNAGLRGRKASAYEGGHRAACFIRWLGGGLDSGKDVDGLTAHLDVMPTLIDLCGLETKERIEFDGVSLVKALRGGESQVPERTLFVHHQGRFGSRIGEGMPIKSKDFAVMSGSWRLVGDELYDLRTDPAQRNNIAGINESVVAKLTAEYENWWADIATTFDRSSAFVIDPAKQRDVLISSQNFLGDNVAYSQHHVRNAMKLQDCWAWIDVQKPGNYRISVRRWPVEVDRAFSAVVESHTVDPGRHELENKLLNLPSRSIPTKKVQLVVGNVDQTIDVGGDTAEAIFEVELNSGLQKIAANLVVPSGEKTSAYYIYISPVVSVKEPMAIWPKLAPGESSIELGNALPSKGESPPITRVKNVRSPRLEVFLAPKPNGASVVILPGGGFNYVVPDLEGSEAATILNQAGYTAFVLRYRTKKNKSDTGWRIALQDSQRAMKYVRANAREWNLDPEKIGLLGFSAGGQVAARLLTDSGKLSYESVDSLDAVSHRPEFSILVYPWRIYDPKLNALLPEIKIDKGLPPTFIVHTHDDRSSSLGSVLFYAGLKKAGGDAELHVYQNGGHGYGVRKVPNSNIGSWPDRMLDWLQNSELSN